VDKLFEDVSAYNKIQEIKQSDCIKNTNFNDFGEKMKKMMEEQTKKGKELEKFEKL
jgi:hypothetical protein